MKYHELQITKAKSAKRLGRGIAAGQGKTAGRGTKGQKSRTGSSKRPGFAGGQNPLMQQLPKLPGFRSYRVKPETIYTSQLEAFAGMTVDVAALAEKRLVSNAFVSVKLIVKGDLTKKVTVQLQNASEAAKAAVEAAGGSFEKTSRPQRPVTSAKKQAKTEAKKA